ESLKDTPAAKIKAKTNVVLTFGGSDPMDLTRKAVEALLSEQWLDVVFHVILGPGYTDVGGIESLVSGQEGSFRVIHNPANIISYFRGSDLVICAGGRTLYELAYLNIPALAVASIKHEVDTVGEFYNEGLLAGYLLEWNEKQFINITINSLRAKKCLDAGN
ncbi:MAG: hypothetical protein KAR47_18920, partial [Planctomycetes bacterium]|nr:hypothetical protein [Planctomycetota bacterium]